MAQLYDANGNPVFTDIVQQSQVLNALNSTNSVQLRGQATATVQVTGIGSLTLTFEGSTDGSNFDPVLGTPIAGGTTVSSTTANGHWINFNISGLFIFRVRVSAYTSGSATVSVIASQGSPAASFSTSGSQRVDVASVNGTPLGTPTNFGTTPGAVVAESANSSVFIGTTAAVAAAAGVQKVGISGATGVTVDAAQAAAAPANNVAVAGVFNNNTGTTGVLAAGNASAFQLDNHGALLIDIISLNGVPIVTNGSGQFVVQGNATPGATVSNLVLTVGGYDGAHVEAISTDTTGKVKVDLFGNAAAVMDAAITAATAPANGLATLSVNNTTAPSLTTGQSVAVQSDYQGSVFVKPYRRGQTVGKSTTISSTTATAIVAAPAAGIFADLSSLVITVTPQATTGEAFTVTVSDGTISYVYDFFTGVAATLAPTSLQICFDPPIPATSAATAWTATVSTVTTQPTIHVTTVAVLQKAS